MRIVGQINVYVLSAKAVNQCGAGGEKNNKSRRQKVVAKNIA